MIKIVCEDQQGGQIAFEYKGYPLALVDLDGFSEIEYTVNTSQSSGQDGETYNGETANKRNPVITAELLADFQAQRDKLYAFFQPRTYGTVYKYEGNMARKATYYIEKIDVAESGPTRPVTISLICPDPLFYDLNQDITQLATWQGCIAFPLRIINPFVATKKMNTLIGNVKNPSNVTQGLIIKFSATGTIVNPSLYDVNRHDTMKIKTTMHSGDVIIVTTATNNKRVQLVSGGTTSNISNLMNYPPVWLQAYSGDNLFRYDAESGIDSLSVSILHTQAYWGA
jgi:hypothetical protein